MSPAKKAVRTKRARDAFREAYSNTTFEVISGLIKGRDEDTIMWMTGVDELQLAAYKAHLTMGTYDNSLVGCNL